MTYRPTRRRLCAAALCAALPVAALIAPVPPFGAASCRAQTATPPATAPYAWQQIKMGAAGFVTGMVVHPTSKSYKYVRTDVGGAYRWVTASGRWEPITEKLMQDNPGANCVESIAVDPGNASVLYLAAGGKVWKSSDRGDTWAATGLSVFTDGNAPWRSTGERLAVDPKNGAVVYFGSRKNGLWRTTDGGASWAKVASLPSAGEAGVGVTFVLVDGGAGTVSGRSKVVYAGVAGAGVYRSADGGSTWTLLSGGPSPAAEFTPKRAALATDRKVYVTYSRMKKWDAANSKWADTWGGPQGGGVYRYPNTGTALADVTPKDASGNRLSGQGYCGITASPVAAGTLMAAEWRFSGGCKFYRSTDDGANWAEVKRNVTLGEKWWPSYVFSTGPATLLTDPENPQFTWMADGQSVWRTDDNRWDDQYWYSWDEGIEELVVTHFEKARGGGPLLSGIMDFIGFTHPADLTQAPASKYEGEMFGNATGFDTVENWPDWVVRTGSNRNGYQFGRLSYDKGATWYDLPLPDDGWGHGGRIAFNSSDGNNLVFMPSNWTKPWFTRDRGAHWAKANFPDVVAVYNDSFVSNMPLAADRKTAGTFYFYGNNGRTYRSTDGGDNWSITSDQQLPWDWHFSLKAAPHKAGEVWISFTETSNRGVWRSADGGSNWTKLANVEDCAAFAFGPPAPGRSGTSTVYLWGKVKGVVGLFRSDDACQTTGNGVGATWVRINAEKPLNAPSLNGLFADRDTYGVVYMASDGRGGFVGRPK
jgi:hypothetical protein